MSGAGCGYYAGDSDIHGYAESRGCLRLLADMWGPAGRSVGSRDKQDPG